MDKPTNQEDLVDWWGTTLQDMIMEVADDPMDLVEVNAVLNAMAGNIARLAVDASRVPIDVDWLHNAIITLVNQCVSSGAEMN